MSNMRTQIVNVGLKTVLNLGPSKGFMCLHLASPVVAGTPPAGQCVTTLGLEKNNNNLRTFTGNWLTICTCLCNLTMHFQVIIFPLRGIALIFFPQGILFHFQVYRERRDVAAFEICLEGY